MQVLAIFGPTASGKTALAIAVAQALRERGEDPVAVSCDAIQVYRGLEVLSGAASAAERDALEHRLLGFVDPSEEWSAGRFAEVAQAEIDELLAEGRRPIVVGGTGLYLRAALSDLDMRPAVDPALREAVERELAERGAEALWAQLEPGVASGVHPNDRKRIARLTELARAGVEAPGAGEGMWGAGLRHPTVLVGLVPDRAGLAQRIDERVEQMARDGAGEEARAAAEAGASRTLRAAIGFEGFMSGDLEAVKAAQRRYARRQLTWMRRMPGVETLETAGRDTDDLAAEVVSRLA